MQLLVLGMSGDRATVVPRGTLDVRVELAETSTVFREETPHISATIKMEQTRAGIFFRYGATERLELQFELPAYHRYRGFLEGAIKATERMTTGLAPARNALQGTGFAYRLSRDGRALFSGGDNEFGIGDLTVSAKYQALTETAQRPALSVRIAVKAPSGDEGRFFGSGHADVGVGLAAEKRLVERVILYANANGIFPTGRISELPLQPFFTGLLAAEYRWSPAFSLVAQFDYYGTPYHNTGTPILDKGVTESVLGFNYRIRSNVLWQVYGIENVDFITGSAADFTLATVVTYRFGR
jgi:hypothetical protein